MSHLRKKSVIPDSTRATVEIAPVMKRMTMAMRALPADARIGAGREFHYRWEWMLRSSPEMLWTRVTDTDRFNRDTAVPAITVIRDRERPNGRRHLKMYRFQIMAHKLIPIEWEEEPFEWLRPYHFGVLRTYSRGPVAYMRVWTQLKALPDGGTRLIYEVWIAPRNLLGYAAIPFQLTMSGFQFGRAFRRYDAELQVEQPKPAMISLQDAKQPLASGGEARIDRLRGVLLNQGCNPLALERLIDLIRRGEGLTLAHIRPYALADAWGLERFDVLELCLKGTRLGLLDFRWELLCPLCRGAKDTQATLGDLPSEVHCEVCNIDFGVNFEQSVELTFRPNPTIRVIEDLAYCVGGPQVTPHIVMQVVLEPFTGCETLIVGLEDGRYRARFLGRKGGRYFEVGRTDGNDDLSDLHLVVPQTPEWSPGAGARRIARTAAITLENPTEEEHLIILERMEWSDQAVVAAEVTTLQVFRDLFSREALRPGTQVDIGSLTLVFTDLRGSSQLYRAIGDAPAFGVVMDHFEVLHDAIAHEGGAIVKTIGDAVMAVFRHPVAAVRATYAAQARLARAEAGRTTLLLKVGIHAGPSIAVTLNERLDYFGTTVNIAARLADLSSGEDIVISSDILRDPEVQAYLDQRDLSLGIEPLNIPLRGLGDLNFELYRINVVSPFVSLSEAVMEGS